MPMANEFYSISTRDTDIDTSSNTSSKKDKDTETSSIDTHKYENPVNEKAIETIEDTDLTAIVEGVASDGVETAKDLCEPAKFEKMAQHFENRAQGFKTTTTAGTDIIDTNKVKEFNEAVYGNSLKNSIERLDLKHEILALVSGGSQGTQETLIRNAIQHTLATANPRDAARLIDSLNKNKIYFTSKNGGFSNIGKSLINSINEVSKGSTATSLKTELKEAIENPKDDQKVKDAVDYINTNKLNTSKVLNKKPVGLDKYSCKTSGDKPDQPSKLYKALFAYTLKDTTPGLENEIKKQLATFNAGEFNKLGSQTKEIAAITTLARDTSLKTNEKLSKLEEHMNKSETKNSLGNIFESIDANVSIENPKHKEILARNSINELQKSINTKGIDLSAKETPWNTTWSDEFRKAVTKLNEKGEIIPTADLLGKILVFSDDKDLQDLARENLAPLLTSVLLHEGEGKEEILKILKEKDPSEYGKTLKEFLGKEDDSKNSHALANTIFSKLENVEYFQSLYAKSLRNPDEQAKLDLLISILHNTDRTVFDVGKNINTYNLTNREIEQQGNTLEKKLQANAIAEVLGKNINDPEIQEILAMADPNGVINAQTEKLNRINQTRKIFKGALSGSFMATALVLTANPATAPVGTVMLGTSALIKGAVMIKNMVQSIKQIGFKGTMKNMAQGFVKSFTFVFDKERTRREKITYGIAFVTSAAARAFLPGIGSAIASVVEGLGAVGAEVELGKRKKLLATEIAAIREMMPNTKYKLENGAEVNIPDTWKEYQRRKEAFVTKQREKALKTGKTPKIFEEYSDKEIFETIKAEKFQADPDTTKEDNFIGAMEVVIERQATIEKLNAEYAEASGRWAAIFAGTMAGAIVGSVARIGINQLNNQGVSTDNPTDKPAGKTETPTDSQPTIDKAGIKQESPITVNNPTELGNSINLDQFPELRAGLEARGMSSSANELFIDPTWSSNSWAIHQRNAVQLILDQGIPLNSQAAGYAIGELAANAVYGGQPINVEALNNALSKAASLNL
jgi:hypothetical protein